MVFNVEVLHLAENKGCLYSHFVKLRKTILFQHVQVNIPIDIFPKKEKSPITSFLDWPHQTFPNMS